MYNGILHFIENDIKEIKNLVAAMLKGEKNLTTCLRISMTGYWDKESGKFVYLLDKILGIKGQQRITLGAASCILEETDLKKADADSASAFLMSDLQGRLAEMPW